MKTILIIEQNSALTCQIKESISKHFPRAQIELAYTPPEAMGAFKAKRHNPVILEIDSAGKGPGFECLLQILPKAKVSSIFVVVDQMYLEFLRKNFSSYNRVYFFERKPVMTDLLNSILFVLDQIPDIISSGLDVISFLQMMHHERKTGYVEILGPLERGYVCFKNGRPFHAMREPWSGAEAIADILQQPFREIRFFEGEFLAEHNLKEDLENLLLHFCKAEDEKSAA